MTLPDWVLIEAAKRFGWDRGRPLSALQKDYGVSTPFRAFCDMILKHEAFRQEVSDAVGRG